MALPDKTSSDYVVNTRREKERDLTQSYGENPYTNRKFNNKLTTQRCNQNFDYTTIADQLMTVRWSNKSHSTGLVKLVYGYQTFPLTAKAMLSKGRTFRNL